MGSLFFLNIHSCAGLYQTASKRPALCLEGGSDKTWADSQPSKHSLFSEKPRRSHLCCAALRLIAGMGKIILITLLCTVPALPRHAQVCASYSLLSPEIGSKLTQILQDRAVVSPLQ